ncbi:MAG: hypothetical protein FWD23_15485 [Oscillospiraceae bacterium]|nr:hypothetical protein [Oscillospiraceae bacterium]
MDSGSQKNFGDEDFIYAMGEEAEQPKHEINIADGYVIMGEEKIIFNRRFLLDKKFSIIMPETFKLMPKELAEIKYPSVNRPNFIYTNEDTTVNFSFTHREEEASNEEIPAFKDAVQELAMRMYPASSVIDSDTLEAGGKNISYYDYIAPALDMNIYTLVFLFSLEGRVVLGGCNCPEHKFDDWKPVFLQMLGSVEVK